MVTKGQGWGEGIDCKGAQGTFGGDGKVLYHDNGGIYTLYIFVKTLPTVHLNLVNFIVYKFSLKSVIL